MVVHGKPKQISAARRLALDVLRRVESEGAFASLALDNALSRHVLTTEDRALSTQLVYGTLRWRRRLDYALAAHSRRPLEKIEPQLLRILRMTTFQLLFLDRIPEWAAVDEGTELAATLRGKSAAGFVNAVLRGLCRMRDHIEWPDPSRDTVRSLAVLHSFPNWMVERFVNRLGQERAVHLMTACNEPAQLWMRANTLRISSAGLQELLAASGLHVEPSKLVPDALAAQGTRDIRSLSAHEAGLLHIQDAGAQLVCHLLGPKPGERVLDACAAPGGKTATLAQMMEDQGTLVAVDRHPARLGLVRQLAERLGIRIIDRIAADLVEQPPELGLFDRVLLDAPCSALGVLRRHPEGKWKLQVEDLERMARVQRELLDRVSALVKPQGTLVYSVCTFSEEEGPILLQGFLGAHPEMELVDLRRESRSRWQSTFEADGTLATWPDLHDMDGFFAARLRRRE